MYKLFVENEIQIQQGGYMKSFLKNNLPGFLLFSMCLQEQQQKNKTLSILEKLRIGDCQMRKLR